MRASHVPTMLLMLNPTTLLTSIQLFAFPVSEPFCSIRPVDRVVAPTFPVTFPLFFDSGPTCPPDIYDVASGQWQTSNPFTSCIDCFGSDPPTSDFDAALTVFFPDLVEVCYTHSCSSSMSEIRHITTTCCTTVSVSFPPCENAAVRCDFSTLTPAVPLTDAGQAQKLRDACYMQAAAFGTTASALYPQGPPLNIFNSSSIKGKAPRHDPDLGSPNRACNNLPMDVKGPGRGKGGKPRIKVNGTMVDNPYQNCDALGNLLIVQHETINATVEANDSANGGCMSFSWFGKSVTLNGIGLLDIEEGASISVSLVLLLDELSCS
jgi:hypothetical protein